MKRDYRCFCHFYMCKVSSKVATLNLSNFVEFCSADKVFLSYNLKIEEQCAFADPIVDDA